MLDKVSLMLQNFFLQAEKAESCNSRLQYNFRNSFPLYHSFINEIQPNLTKRGKFLEFVESTQQVGSQERVIKEDIFLLFMWNIQFYKNTEEINFQQTSCVPLQCGFSAGNAASLREQTKALAVDRDCTSLWKLFIYQGCVMLFHCVTLPIIVTELNDKVLSPHWKFRAASFHFSAWSREHCWTGTTERQEQQTGNICILLYCIKNSAPRQY